MFKLVDPDTNFPELEKKWLKYWDEKGIVKKYLTKKYVPGLLVVSG